MTSDDSGTSKRQIINSGRTAVDYERHRPGFPDGFLDRLVGRRWVARGQHALDLGTGTGPLALGSASRGVVVTDLDIALELLVSRFFPIGKDESTILVERGRSYRPDSHADCTGRTIGG